MSEWLAITFLFLWILLSQDLCPVIINALGSVLPILSADVSDVLDASHLVVQCMLSLLIHVGLSPRSLSTICTWHCVWCGRPLALLIRCLGPVPVLLGSRWCLFSLFHLTTAVAYHLSMVYPIQGHVFPWHLLCMGYGACVAASDTLFAGNIWVLYC